MPWCPKCENEYYEGIKVCADCGCELVAELPKKEEEIPYPYAQILAAAEAEALSESQGTDAESLEETAEPVDERYAEHDTEKYVQYMSKGSKAEDNRSSGKALVFVGVLGIIFLVLCYLNIIPMSFHMLVYVVMGIMFVGFIIFGVEAFLSAGKFSKEADAEKTLHSEILNWGLENIDPKSVDASAGLAEEESEEEKYFKRSSAVRVLIIDNFPDADKVLIDHILDEELYDKLFETEEA